MTTHQFWDQIFCPKHGWVSHVVIHEAAHAVFALKNGFSIREVRIGPPASLMGLVDGRSAVAGGAVVEGDPNVWIPARGETALDLLLIGRVAENRFLEHSLRSSDEGDLRLWASATGSAPTTEQKNSSRTRMWRELGSVDQAILAVAREFRDRLGVDGEGRYFDFDEAVVLSGEDLVRIVSESTELPTAPPAQK